jgi:DNA processing protein
MLPGEESYAWISLTRAPASSPDSLATALETFGSARVLLESSDAARRAAGVPAATCEFLSSAHAPPSAAERAWLEDPCHALIPFTDPRYPKLVRNCARHPLALYVAGTAELMNDPQLAIVGSRNPSAQGRETAHEFAEDLAARGLGIVSGLAMGVDTSAHCGALAAQGTTLAVLGSGVDVVYPSGNASLAAEIRRCGALISAFPLGTAPRREHFPQRNWLIAAFGLGTLVIEAARRSGSLITARLAADLGRRVFAVPGSIRSPLSRGCHQLIRQGATLAESAHDILTELNFSAFFAQRSASGGGRGAAPTGQLPMDKEQKILLDALGFDPTDLDLLIVRTGFKPEAVSSMMLILELEGHVQAAPGGRYSRVVRSRR